MGGYNAGCLLHYSVTGNEGECKLRDFQTTFKKIKSTSNSYIIKLKGKLPSYLGT